MDKGSIATLKAAILAVLNNTVPDQSIEPDDHNTLLDDLLDTITGLDKVLRENNKTGGYSLEISAGDLLKLTSGAFTGDISPLALTAPQTYQFQDASGVVAFLSDIPTVISLHSGLTLDDGTNPHATTKTDVGLPNVDNTSDANKPVSIAQQTEFDKFEYEVSFVEVEEVLQVFRFASSITALHVANIATLEYDINESASFVVLTIDGSGNVTGVLPIALSVNDTVTWRITYSSGKDKASINIIGTK